MIRGHQPTGQIEAVGERSGRLHRGEDRRHRTADLLARGIVLTAHHDEALAGFIHVAPDEGLRNLIPEFIPLLAQVRHGGVERIQSGPSFRTHFGQVMLPEHPSLFRRPLIGCHVLEDLSEILRHFLGLLALVLSNPRREREPRIPSWIDATHDPGAIPMN